MQTRISQDQFAETFEMLLLVNGVQTSL
jgi:hypothetical protein